MKLRVTIGGIVLAAMIAVVMFAVLFSACEDTYVESYTPEAQLLSLRVRNTDIAIQGTNIPAPIDQIDWGDDGFDLYNQADFKTISFKRDSDIEDARFLPTVSRGAKVKWGVANRTVRPNDFYDTRVPATFDARDFIYFEVTSEDDKIINYYRFSTYLSSPVKELSSIKLAGRAFEGDITEDISPDDTWDGARIKQGDINITIEEAENAEIDAVPWADTANLRFAVTNWSANRDIEPVFTTDNKFSFKDTQFLYVEVSAENTVDKNFYCFNVYVGRIATVAKLTFINPIREEANEGTGTFEALGKGTAKNRWSDNSGAGSFDSPHQPVNGFIFAVELDEPAGSWRYRKMNSLPNSNTEPTDWIIPTGGNGGTPTVRLEHGEYLAIKVIPPNRQGSRPDYFYKVKMGNLAAEFIKQPKSAWYEKGATADALDFTLDRPIPDGTTYQWYEANSWYGGYGFDSEGLIGEKGTLVAEKDWGDKDRGIYHADGSITFKPRSDDPLPDLQTGEMAFDVTAWHQIALDEKNNVSLHNGGNQFYNLPTPGRPIPKSKGGQNPIYKPDTNFRPFITNFSNESHYYWVEVTMPTDGGTLKAVSARAVIVTEWRVKYHNGHEEPYAAPEKDWEKKNQEIRDKKHHIIDLYAYQTPGAHGLQAPPRNAIPFAAGNHGSSYWIPVTFPPGFDIMEYSVFTAQALFFLADGREWIQNWTQGDIGFGRTKIVEKTDEDGNVIQDEDGNPILVPVPGEVEEIVLWYNLTNDNATRGLASSGNEPQGGGLIVTPEYIVVKPAGTKPIKQMPPFMNPDLATSYDSVGRLKPLNNNNAQGWFTPYIELCELRFEGPTRYEYCDCASKEECEAKDPESDDPPCGANCNCEHCK